MKTVQKAISVELIQAFFLSLVALNFILMMEKVLRLSRVLSGVGASLADMTRITLYLQPQLLILTIPMSLLLSTLLTYGRLNADSELTILKTAGMSFREISLPVFMFGALCFLSGLLVSFSLGPSGAIRVKETISSIIMQKAPMAIEAGIFNTSFKDVVILARERPTPDTMKGIFIYDSRDKKEPKVLLAKEGRISADRDNNLSIYMKTGYMHIARSGGSTEIFFDGYNLSLNLTMESPSKKTGEMTPLELIESSRGKEPRDRISYFLEFHRRLSLPSLCLILSILGPPLALLSGRSGRFGGLVIGIGVFTLFYMMLIYGENLARSGSVPHFMGAWVPVVVVVVSSVVAFGKAASR